MPRVKTSNCVSCLFWFGSDAIGILPILIGMKEAKAAASQLRSPAGCGGENIEFKRENEIIMHTKLFLG